MPKMVLEVINYSDLTITHNSHVLNYHTITRRFVQAHANFKTE